MPLDKITHILRAILNGCDLGVIEKLLKNNTHKKIEQLIQEISIAHKIPTIKRSCRVVFALSDEAEKSC